MPSRVALAGSTGSIGTQTLDVVAAEPDRFELIALGASGRKVELLVGPRPVDRRQGRGRRRRRPVPPSWPPRLPECEVRAGAGALASLATEADVVVNGVVGFAGLPRHPGHARGRPAPGAGQQGVAHRRRARGAAGAPHARRRAGAGRQRARRHPPVPAGQRRDPASGWRELVLTASGGPFRGRTPGRARAAVTVDDALAHPTWSMGPKITVDSSTLMNKGLEVIEAHELFGAPAGEPGSGIGFDQIEVVVHPQSIVHSMVELHRRRPPSPSCRCPTCACPSATPWPAPTASTTPFGAIDWADLGPPRLRAARPRRLPLPRPGLRRRPGRGHGPRLAQRRQRGGGGRLPRRADPVDPDRRGPRRGPRARHDGSPATDRSTRGRRRPPRPRRTTELLAR